MSKRNLILGIVLGLGLWLGAPHAPFCARPTQNGVLCCCVSGNGRTCCAEVAFCGGLIPGCVCR